MKFIIENNTATVLLLVFALLAGGVSILVYYKNRKNSELSVLQCRVLAVLRAVSIFICLTLLLKPIVILKKQVKEKPLIVVAADNSQSLLPFKTAIKETLNKLDEKLKRKYTVEHWLFGEKAVRGDTPVFVAPKSDYSDLLASVANQYVNKNIGALILLGDGIYNAGQNPLNQVSKLNFPVYTVGFGDTISIPDIRISGVKHNRTVFINNYFSLEADIHFSKLRNQVVRIEIIHDNEIVDSKTITIPTNNYFISEAFSIQASRKGLQKYKVRVAPVEGEKNTDNNSHEFVIDVIDTKHHILILSDGPHPDIGALKTILENYSNFELTLINGNILPEKVNDFDLFVLYQLPSAHHYNSQALQDIFKSKKPLLFIVGEKTSLPLLNNLQMGISTMAGKGMNECQFLFNKDFSLFKIENEYTENIENFPPLYVPYADFKMVGDLQVLGSQRIKGINTSDPLITLGTLNGRKIGYILGEGIWRWRIFDFSINNNFKAVNELIFKIFNYLVLKENEENFKLFFSTTYSDNEEVIIGAELYNDSYELVNTPDVSMVLHKDSLSEYRFIFDKVENKYLLNLGKPGTGNYQMKATVQLGEKEYKSTGNFMVVRLNLEEQQTIANHQFLYQLAYESGARFFLPENQEQLFSAIQSDNQIKPDKFVHYAQNELLNSKWLFALIILVFGMEWFLRKYWGIY